MLSATRLHGSLVKRRAHGFRTDEETHASAFLTILICMWILCSVSEDTQGPGPSAPLP